MYTSGTSSSQNSNEEAGPLPPPPPHPESKHGELEKNLNYEEKPLPPPPSQNGHDQGHWKDEVRIIVGSGTRNLAPVLDFGICHAAHGEMGLIIHDTML